MNQKEIKEWPKNNPEIVKKAEKLSRKKGFYISRETPVANNNNNIEDSAMRLARLKEFLDEI